jgi:hypothetical protein
MNGLTGWHFHGAIGLAALTVVAIVALVVWGRYLLRKDRA